VDQGKGHPSYSASNNRFASTLSSRVCKGHYEANTMPLSSLSLIPSLPSQTQCPMRDLFNSLSLLAPVPQLPSLHPHRETCITVTDVGPSVAPLLGGIGYNALCWQSLHEWWPLVPRRKVSLLTAQQFLNLTVVSWLQIDCLSWLPVCTHSSSAARSPDKAPHCSPRFSSCPHLFH
jgi:hypothetical protein